MRRTHRVHRVAQHQRGADAVFPYTVKYIESESDIQNNDLLYKTNQ